MCVHVLNKKRERKKKRTYQEWRDSYREKCRKRGREREREKMYPSKQLDPGSCPSLVSTIRSFVVPLIDTHSSSQFLRTVIFGNLAILFLSRCFSPLLLLVLCILIDFLILEYSFCNVSIASFLFSFFLYLKKNFFFYFHVYILFFDLSIFLFNSLRFLIAKQKTIATTDAVASQNRFNRPDHPYSSGNHSTWMITVDSMRPFHARCRLNILFFFFSFFKNCSRSRYPCAHAYTETSFLSFFFFIFAFRLSMIGDVQGDRLCMSRGCSRATICASAFEDLSVDRSHVTSKERGGRGSALVSRFEKLEGSSFAI